MRRINTSLQGGPGTQNPFRRPLPSRRVAECASFRLIYNEDYNKQTNLRQ